MDRSIPTPRPDHEATPEPGDRILAAFAYLGYLAGLWLLAPIAVYLWRRKHSRFVAHHAVRALIVHLLLVPLAVLLTMFGFSLGMAAVTSVDANVGSGISTIFAFALLAACLTGFTPGLITLIVTLVPAFRAYQGHLDPHSRLGRISESLLRTDSDAIGK